MLNPVEIRAGTKAGQWPIIRLPAAGRKQVVLALFDPNGKPVHLEEEPVNPGADTPQFGYQRQLGPGNVEIRLRARLSITDPNNQIDLVGKIVTGTCKNQVVFEIAEQTTPPGIYVAEVGRFVKPDYLVDTWPCYLALEPSVFQQQCNEGPLTIAELRLELGDLENGEVSLLDGLEFSDREILHCINEVVSRWNESLPVLRPFYTSQNFPYRHYWAVGAISQLYDIAARKYRRNQLPYSAGGLTIDDQNKSAEYQAIADALQEEFDTWMRGEKVRLNARRGWRTI